MTFPDTGPVRRRLRPGAAPRQGTGGRVAHAPAGAAFAGDRPPGDHRSTAGPRHAEDVQSRTSGELGGTEKVFKDRVILRIIGGRE